MERHPTPQAPINNRNIGFHLLNTDWGTATKLQFTIQRKLSPHELQTSEDSSVPIQIDETEGYILCHPEDLLVV